MKGKKIFLIIIPLFVILGAVTGLAISGIIHIPGISPERKPAWEKTLTELFRKYGEVKPPDMVAMKNPPAADLQRFVDAAKQAGFEPVSDPKGVKSKKLVEWLQKQTELAPKPAPVAAKPKPTPAPTPPPAPATPAGDPERGIEHVASIWNGLEPRKLAEVAKEYRDPELVRVLLKMEPDVVIELLNLMDGKRAAAISRELQRQGAFLPPPEEI